jgi:hypothetical protein
MGNTMTPFPALHTTANSAADEHVHEARKLAEDAQAWLAELDELLGETPAS